MSRQTRSRLLGLCSLLLAACGGGDMEIFLQIDNPLCLTVEIHMRSLEVFVAEENPNQRVLLAQQTECIEATFVGTAPAISQVLADRGYVARDVNAKTTTRIVLIPRTSETCAGESSLCLLSDPIPPGGSVTRVAMHSVCPPAAPPPSPGWLYCNSVEF